MRLDQNLNERLVLNELLQKKEAAINIKKKSVKRPKSVTKTAPTSLRVAEKQ